MKTITGKINVFVTYSSLEYGYDKNSVGAYFYTDADMTTEGWALAGTAEITVTLKDDDAFKSSIIESLKAEKQKVLADAHVKAMQIDERIQSLLCIEHKEVSNG